MLPPLTRTGRLVGRFERWLLGSMPPLSGRLRFVFYGGSLCLFAFLNDGLSFTLGEASPGLYQPRGITALLGVPYLSPGAMRGLMAVTYLAWLCAAVGLLTRPAKILTAVGLLLALGFEQAYEAGGTHAHYLLLYALVLLSYSTSDRDWSVDAWLRRRRGITVEGEGGAASTGGTGLPRTGLLILAVSFYCASGLSKLIDAGPLWMDGQSLQHYIASQVDRTSFEIVTSLRIWVSGQRWLCLILSAVTLVIELGSPVALFSRRLRHLWIAAWISMHLGIVVLMAPNYWIQSWCVGILLTDWAWLRRAWESRSLAAADRLRPGPPVVARLGVRAWVLVVALLSLAVLPPLVQIEWFPVTHVPMYASYVTPDVVGGVPVGHFRDATAVRVLARRCAGGRAVGYIRRCPWQVPREIVGRVTLELVRREGEPVRVSGDLGRLRYPVIEQLAAGSEQKTRTTAELVGHVQALLRARPPHSLAGFERFRLEYQLNEGSILLAEGAVEARP